MKIGSGEYEKFFDIVPKITLPRPERVIPTPPGVLVRSHPPKSIKWSLERPPEVAPPITEY